MKNFFIHQIIKTQLFRKMNGFTQILNPILNLTEWETQREDYDYHQEVARSAFADMLHDTERNKKYYQALKIAIDNTHKLGLKANVLDIGTGTGLLSMMAVKCGADSVIACEAFLPMAECAEKIMENNGMKDKIKLIKKRSTELTIGPGKDMDERANILVTEVFDTELIGEGAIGTFNHAHKHLLVDNCIVVPDSATIYIQVVESPLVFAWNKPKLIANLDGEVLITTPQEILKCPGSSALHDVQLSQIPYTSFQTLIGPEPVLQFDWSGKNVIPTKQSIILKFKALNSGMAQAVFMWWDLKMDQKGEILLSCAPYWAHPDNTLLPQENRNKKSIPWRDHWMQAIYYLPQENLITKDKELTLVSNHDEYSLWFSIKNNSNKDDDNNVPTGLPSCICGYHIVNCRTRIGQLNDNLRNKKYMKFLEDNVTSGSVVLSVSDGTMLGIISSALGAKYVYCLEKNRYYQQVIESYIKENQLKNIRIIKSLDEIKNFDEISHVVSEPSYLSSIVPWDNFYFGTILRELKSKLQKSVVLMPQIAKIYAMPVEFSHLHKIRSPLGICEEFDLKIFDQLIKKASLLSDSNVEAQPLWEYPCKSLGNPVEIMSVDFTDFDKIQKKSGKMFIKNSGVCNGIVLWVDWHLDDTSKKSIISTGPSSISIEPHGEYVNWDIHVRQGVHLFPEENKVFEKDYVNWENVFIPERGDIKFKFNFK